MIRIALYGTLIAIAASVGAIVADLLMPPEEPPAQSINLRFPDGWESVPVVEYKTPEPEPEPEPWLSAVAQLSEDEFIAAVSALDRLRGPIRSPQPADAVLSDAQIASLKDRLKLTAQQQPYWRAVEASLREVVWDRSQGRRARLDVASVERLREAAAPFVATLSAKQRAEIQALANIAGLRLDLSAAQ